MEKLKRLIWITVWLVGLVLLLTGFGFYYISLKSGQDGAREEIERISEKQQILSQRIVRNILLADGSKGAAGPESSRELQQLLQTFHSQHQFLTWHAADAGLGSKSEKAQLSQLIKKVEPYYNTIRHSALASLGQEQASLSNNSTFLAQLEHSELEFLEKMNRISSIARFNQETVDGQVYLLNVFIYATLIIALIILGLMVITPVFKKSIRDYRELLSAKNQIEITGRALGESEEKYRHLFASNPLPMWLFDPENFRFLDVNDIACSHYGYTREEFLTMTIADIRPEEQRETFVNAEHPLSLPPDEYDRGTWRHRKKDGSEITVEIFAHDALFNGANARMVVINDITKRKAAEEKLVHNEANLRQAQQMAHFGHWELDFSDGLATWSEEHCRIYGLETSNNRHSFESWLSFVHPEDVGFLKEAIKGGSKSFHNASLLHRIVRPDGSTRHLNIHSRYKHDNKGRPSGLYGVSHDVTESKEAESLLAQSEANLRMIMDLLPQRIFIKDRSGRFLFVNQSFAELYGMGPKEFISASRARELPELEGDQAYQRDDREVITGGKKKIVPEETFLGPNGEQKIFHVTKLPYFWGRENQQSVLGILNEITEQKRAEAERNAMLADLVRRNESLEQFAYIISHNLRAPVANIMALSQLVESSCEDPADHTALAQNLSASTQKLDGVIKDLNKILRSTHHSSEQKETVSFTALCDESMAYLAVGLIGEGAQLVTDFSAVDEIYITKSYLYSIFYNLISNSIKYRRAGVPLLINISSQLNSGQIGLTLTDNGLGMDLEKIGDELFGLYKRFHGHIEGKGMGLYMVKRHVEIMGGEISVSSKVDEGTTFRITFP
jgi:PAS domain S-box-containing protein